MNILKEHFGKKDNQTVHQYTIINDHGVEISCINYGCIITKINVPDRTMKILSQDTTR